MRLKIEMVSEDGKDNIMVPLHYNKALQGLIYSMVGHDLPNLHDIGYTSGSRTFRMFVFSRLTGNLSNINCGKITFNSPIIFKVASPDVLFIEALADNLLKAPVIRLADSNLSIKTISVEPEPDFRKGQAWFKAASAITVYSTLLSPDGKKKTYYYHPTEKEFFEQIKNNLKKKAEILGLDVNVADTIEIKSVRVRNKDQKIVYYNNMVIKGWMGLYEIHGDPRILSVGYNTGIGAKNSQGFGMLDYL